MKELGRLSLLSVLSLLAWTPGLLAQGAVPGTATEQVAFIVHFDASEKEAAPRRAPHARAFMMKFLQTVLEGGMKAAESDAILGVELRDNISEAETLGRLWALPMVKSYFDIVIVAQIFGEGQKNRFNDKYKMNYKIVLKLFNSKTQEKTDTIERLHEREDVSSECVTNRQCILETLSTDTRELAFSVAQAICFKMDAIEPNGRTC